MTRLSSLELNMAFVDALGDYVVHVEDLHAPTLELRLSPPFPRDLRVYLFNATNPPGGRSTPEHKVQLRVPGQSRAQRGNFDFSGGWSVMLAGKVEDVDVFVLWDAQLYRDFAWSRNVQVRTEIVEDAETTHSIKTQQRRLRLGDETAIVTPSALLADAIAMRFSGDTGALVPPTHTPSVPALPATGGTAYSPPPRTGNGEPETRVFEVDPDLIDRGTTAHMVVQDALAKTLQEHGLEPLSPRPGDPPFDIAWRQDGVAYIAEVKSLTDANEVRQLRLGLGQVLTYAHLLDWPDVQAVRPVLAVERKPIADYWMTLCAEHDVILTWPEAYDDMFVEAP